LTRRISGCFELELTVACGACGAAVPVPGLVARARCQRCAAEIELGDVWRKALEDDRLKQAQRAPGVGQHVRFPFVQGADFRFAVRAPRCLDCADGVLDPDSLVEAAEGASGRCFCPACGVAIPLRAADDIARSFRSDARALVHEAISLGEGTDIETARAPVAFPCATCGAALRADGSTRAVECVYCAAANYLPDALWQRLHPSPTAHPWFLILGGRRRRT
jgi:DNA-directed RNA polymerase subunit RPC12/RpoP